MSDRGGPQFIPRPPDWSHGDPPSWIEPASPTLSVADVAARLRNYAPREIVRSSATRRPDARGPRSAVLIGLYDSDDGATTILTRRPEHMRKHAGEVAFPGGAVDDTDESLWAAATREAHEEIDLHPTAVQRIGELDRFVTGASYSLVTPFVGSIAELPDLTPSPDEVDEIIHVPLTELLDTEVYRHERWLWEGEWRSMHFFDLMGDTVWGATAVMLHRFLEVISGADDDSSG